MQLFSKTKNEKPAGTEADFTVHCSPFNKCAYTVPESLLFSLFNKTEYAGKFVESFKRNGILTVDIPGSISYDSAKHSMITQKCIGHLEAYADILSGHKPLTDNTGPVSIAELPSKVRDDINEFLRYDTLMIDAAIVSKNISYLFNPQPQHSVMDAASDIFKNVSKAMPSLLDLNIKKAVNLTTKGLAGAAICSSYFFGDNLDNTKKLIDINQVYDSVLHHFSSVDFSFLDFSIMPKASAETASAQGVPPMPMNVWGYATYDGNPANLSETSLTAKINDTLIFSVPMSEYMGNSVFNTNLPSDDSSTPEVEGGNNDEIIVFSLYDSATDQTFLSPNTTIFISGASIQNDLTFTDTIPPVLGLLYTVTGEDPDGIPDDINISADTNELTTLLIKEGGSELFNSSDLKKYWNVMLNNQTKGDHTYNVTAADSNGNPTTTQLTVSIDYETDTTPPALTDSSVSVEALDVDGKKDDLDISFNTTEDADYQLWLNDILVKDFGSIYEGIIETEIKNNTDGTYNLYVVLKDEAGNPSDKISLGEYTIDTIPPSIIDFTAKVDGNDMHLQLNLSEIAKAYAEIAGITGANTTDTQNSTLIINDIPEGVYDKINVTVTDPFGNSNSTALNYSITITAPDDNGKKPNKGGGSGGGGNTGEDYDNIWLKLTERELLKKDGTFSYHFDDPDSFIKYLNGTSTANKGKKATVIELLNGPSSLVPETAAIEDSEYIPLKYYNMYIGKKGFDGSVTNTTVDFTVLNEILDQNSLDIDSVCLGWYDKTEDIWRIYNGDTEHLGGINGTQFFNADIPQVSGQWGIFAKAAGMEAVAGSGPIKLDMISMSPLPQNVIASDAPNPEPPADEQKEEAEGHGAIGTGIALSAAAYWTRKKNEKD